MTALLIAGTAWALLSAPLALLLGKVISQADRRDGAAALAADPDLFASPDGALLTRAQRG